MDTDHVNNHDEIEKADDDRADEFAGGETRDEETLDTSDGELPEVVDRFVVENEFPSEPADPDAE